MFWTNDLPYGSPTHTETPYAFKAYALAAAFRAGFAPVLWCDAAVWVVRSLDPVWERLRDTGAYLVAGGWNTGEWCADQALGPLGLTRDESFAIPHLTACIMGLDPDHAVAGPVWRDYFAHAQSGVAFRGPWTNSLNEASRDSRVRGHRHDQTVLSVLSHRAGLPWITEPAAYPLVYHRDGQPPLPRPVVFCSRGGSCVDWPTTLED